MSVVEIKHTHTQNIHIHIMHITYTDAHTQTHTISCQKYIVNLTNYLQIAPKIVEKGKEGEGERKRKREGNRRPSTFRLCQIVVNLTNSRFID